MGIIYKHTINNKAYIGKTIGTLERRLNQHKRNAINNGNTYFCNAIRKYGTDHIISEVLETCADSVLSEREKFWIAKFDTYKNGYNMTLGGDGGATRNGQTNSAEHRKKSSEAQLGKKKKPGNKCGQYAKSDKHKQKLSEIVSCTAWVCKDGVEQKIHKSDLEEFEANGYKHGRNPMSEESKLKLTKHFSSPEQRKKMSNAIKGRIYIHQPETKTIKCVFINDFINTYEMLGYKKGRK